MSLEWEVLLRVLLAGVLGAAVGFDRERTDKPAGLRTHMLVSMGSALFAAIGILIVDQAMGDEAVVRLDILRVVAAVATGVGFLGGGAILRGDHRVRGLTTAAGIWVNAGIGLAAGLGQIILAVGATVFAVIIVAALGGGSYGSGKGSLPSRGQETGEN
ncbi:MAG TPA: MgtC/SapB family protein [Acidimicrobiia bacterium]|nr:MgtC/SapB family protein [Acidimicrobiia bacterium]